MKYIANYLHREIVFEDYFKTHVVILYVNMDVSFL